MGIFDKLFRSKKLKITDPDYGDIESVHIKGAQIDWLVKHSFLGSQIDVFLKGDINGVFDSQKCALQNVFSNEAQIATESQKSLQEQFDNADKTFISIDHHFDIRSIFLLEEGFELTFQEKESPYYFFNITFINYKAQGVFIDG